jgi:hypothetical protein
MLIELWRTYNLHLAYLIRQIPSDKLGCHCTIGSGGRVRLDFLIEDYVAHLKMHLKQLGF